MILIWVNLWWGNQTSKLELVVPLQHQLQTAKTESMRPTPQTSRTMPRASSSRQDHSFQSWDWSRDQDRGIKTMSLSSSLDKHRTDAKWLSTLKLSNRLWVMSPTVGSYHQHPSSSQSHSKVKCLHVVKQNTVLYIQIYWTSLQYVQTN